jgi:PGF-pre-PGF domain-containing protein
LLSENGYGIEQRDIETNPQQKPGTAEILIWVPPDEVYKYVNIWVGNGGVVSSKNIENAVVSFKVEKSWVQDKKIDKSSITLNRYNGSKWDQLPTNLSKEDENYLYLTAKTQSFSPFAITGKTPANVIGTLPAGEKIQPAVSDTKTKLNTGNNTSNLEHTQEKMQSSNISGKQSTRVPGFEIASCIGCLLCVYLYKKRND